MLTHTIYIPGIHIYVPGGTSIYTFDSYSYVYLIYCYQKIVSHQYKLYLNLKIILFIRFSLIQSVMQQQA